MSSLEKFRRETVERHISNCGVEDAVNGQYRHLLESITQSAKEYADTKNMSEDNFENLILQAIDVVSSLQYGLSPRDEKSLDTIYKDNLWYHDKTALMRVKNKDVPYIHRELVEDAVSEYLNLPFRSKIIDRLILDLLIAIELYGFGDQMLNPIFRSLSPLKKTHPSTLFLIGLISSGLIFIGGGALSIYSGTQGWISEGWSTGIAVSLIGLFIVIFLFSAISLPFEWVQDSKTRNV